MLMWLLLASLAQNATPPTQAAVTLRPDVLVFVLDDVADSDIDAIPALTNIHSLAAQGVRFTRCYGQAWCAPARDSLLRSKLAGIEHGEACAPCAAPLVAGTPTLPRLLLGYHTCTLGKWHLGSAAEGRWEDTPDVWGFENARRERPIGEGCTDIPGGAVWVDDGVVTQFSADDSITLRDAVLAWWAETKAPRFAIVNFAAGHYPFKFPPSSILPVGYPHPPFASNRKSYEAELVGADFVIGQILKECHADVVIFTADNGTPGALPGQGLEQSAARPDQDPQRLKGTCYEDGVKVPLIIVAPKVHVGVCTDVVSLSDLMPTLLELGGSSPWGETIEGRSLVPVLRGESLTPRNAFTWSPPRADMAAISQRWKLLTDIDGVEVLYDLEADPHELNALPPEGDEADRLRAWRQLVLEGF